MYPLEVTMAPGQSTALFPLEASTLQGLEHSPIDQDVPLKAGHSDAPPTGGSSKKQGSRSPAGVDQRFVQANVARFHDAVRLLANKYRSILAQVCVCVHVCVCIHVCVCM